MSAAHLERSPDLLYSIQDGYLYLIPATGTSRVFHECVGIGIVGEAERSGQMVEQVEPAELEQRVQSLWPNRPASLDKAEQPEPPAEPLQSVLHYARCNRDHR